MYIEWCFKIEKQQTAPKAPAQPGSIGPKLKSTKEHKMNQFRWRPPNSVGAFWCSCLLLPPSEMVLFVHFAVFSLLLPSLSELVLFGFALANPSELVLLMLFGAFRCFSTLHHKTKVHLTKHNTTSNSAPRTVKLPLNGRGIKSTCKYRRN